MTIGLLIPDRPLTPSNGRAQHYRRHGFAIKQATRRFDNGTTITFGPHDPIYEFQFGEPFFEQALSVDNAVQDIEAEIKEIRRSEASSLGLGLENLSLLDASISERFPGHFRSGSNESIPATQIGMEDTCLNSTEGVLENSDQLPKRTSVSIYRSTNHSNNPGLDHPGYSTDTRGGIGGYPGGSQDPRAARSPARNRIAGNQQNGFAKQRPQCGSAFHSVYETPVVQAAHTQRHTGPKFDNHISRMRPSFLARRYNKRAVEEQETLKQKQMMGVQGGEFLHPQNIKYRGRSSNRHRHPKFQSIKDLEMGRSMTGPGNHGSVRGSEQHMHVQPTFCPVQHNKGNHEILKWTAIKDQIILLPRGEPGLPLAYLIDSFEPLNHSEITELVGPREKWAWMLASNINKYVSGNRPPELEAVLNAIINGNRMINPNHLLPANGNVDVHLSMANMSSRMNDGIPRMGHVREASAASSTWHKESVNTSTQRSFFNVGPPTINGATEVSVFSGPQQYFDTASNITQCYQAPVNPVTQVNPSAPDQQYVGYWVPGEPLHAPTASLEPSPQRGASCIEAGIRQGESRFSSPGGYISRHRSQISPQRETIVRSQSQIFTPVSQIGRWM